MPSGDDEEITARGLPLPGFGEDVFGERLLVGLFAGKRFLGELLTGALFLSELLAAGRNILE
ncbi:hypothetical protein [Bradyrhizobium sp. BR13661]|jgi:hypothetical protein|uniref:hypothetical protein n=1 Tax=Bradyrhizobium sp. BR13661 TaxID=2940622 RepID=UPI002473F4B0|nr:hypothetical protein [Bradyrhizobium sp. BR13661]